MRHVVCFYDLGEAVPVLGILIPLFAAFGDVERGVQVGVQVEGFIFHGRWYHGIEGNGGEVFALVESTILDFFQCLWELDGS